MTTWQAIEQGKIEEIRGLLVDHVARRALSKDGAKLARRAAVLGQLAILKLLVEESHLVTFDQPDENGRNALHDSVVSGDLQTVIYCKERLGFDPLAADYHGVTPFDLAHGAGLNDIEAYFEICVGATYEQMYHNPIRHGFYADPSIVRVGTDYYMVNSSFVFFPSIPISHSKDLINWTIIGYAIVNESWAELEGKQCGHGYWAPDISYHQGQFWICATLRGDSPQPLRRQMITCASKPEGPYRRPNFIDVNGIDPSIFCDADGRRYMLVNPGARIFEINAEGEQISEPRLLYFGDMKRKAEAPHLLKKDDWYYLFLAEGGTGEGHRVTVARSKELMGIYTACPYNPIMHQPNVNAYITRTGHAKLVETSEGEWFGVYLCTRRTDGYSTQGRETGLDRVTWTADGWPIFNSLKGPSALQRKPNLPWHEWDVPANALDINELQNGWMALRRDFAKFVQYDKGVLTISAGNSLHMGTGVSALLRRQTEKAFSYQAVIAGLDEQVEAGVVGYYDENSYFTFGVRKSDEVFEFVITEGVNGTERVLWTSPAKALPITLRVTVSGLNRQCWMKSENDDFQLAYGLKNLTYLADEGLKGARFTGAMHGIYAIKPEKLTGQALVSAYKIDND